MPSISIEWNPTMYNPTYVNIVPVICTRLCLCHVGLLYQFVCWYRFWFQPDLNKFKYICCVGNNVIDQLKHAFYLICSTIFCWHDAADNWSSTTGRTCTKFNRSVIQETDDSPQSGKISNVYWKQVGGTTGTKLYNDCYDDCPITNETMFRVSFSC